MQQKIAKKAQNADRVTAFISVIDIQKRIEMIWPPQNAALLSNAGTLLSSDSKHQT